MIEVTDDCPYQVTPRAVKAWRGSGGWRRTYLIPCTLDPDMLSRVGMSVSQNEIATTSSHGKGSGTQYQANDCKSTCCKMLCPWGQMPRCYGFSHKLRCPYPIAECLDTTSYPPECLQYKRQILTSVGWDGEKLDRWMLLAGA